MEVKKIPLIIIAAVCIIPAVIINTAAAYVPFAFVLLFGVASVTYTLLSACFFRIDAEAPGLRRYERAASADCRVRIANRGLLPLPHVTLTLTVKSEQGLPPIESVRHIMLRPRERLELVLPLRFPHIGRYRVKVGSVRFHGFLGVFSFALKPKWFARVHITPKRYEMPGLRLNTTHAAFAVEFSAPRKISGGEYSDVREYSPGDPIKNIHWKLSAHTMGYVTRLYKTDAVSGIAVYIDFRCPQRLGSDNMADINDCAAESAFSAAAQALELGYSVSLIYSHMNNPVVTAPRSLDDLTVTAYSLPPVSVSERYPVELLVTKHSEQASSPDNIIVLTANVTDRLITELASCVQKGKFPTLCHISAEPPDSELSERITGKGIEYLIIDLTKTFAAARGGAR